MARNIWLVSNDSELVSSLSSSTQDSYDLTATTLPDFQQAGHSDSAVEAIFLDLREPQGDRLWHSLTELRQRWRDSHGLRAPFIGVVDGDFSLQQAAIADQTLAGTLVWPAPSVDWADLLSGAASTELAAGKTRVGEHRTIKGTKSEFLTYTPALFLVLEDLALAAARDFTVLLIGETGTGKTTLARIVHELSPRRDKCFLTVACGSLPGELIDSELFGHVKGAFTGADRTKEGKFDAADGGAILLDEIDVLGTSQQAKLLRVLETGEFEPVGSNETRKTTARTIAASNVCLQGLIDEGRFRADLFYRLDQVRFEIPPLRERPRDIVPIALHSIEQAYQDNDGEAPRIAPDFLAGLKRHTWPGNIRELCNEVLRAALFCRGGVLRAEHLSPKIANAPDRPRAKRSAYVSASHLAGEVAETERDAIETMLASHEFNRAATARALGISRVTLYNKMRKYGIRTKQRSS